MSSEPANLCWECKTAPREGAAYHCTSCIDKYTRGLRECVTELERLSARCYDLADAYDRELAPQP